MARRIALTVFAVILFAAAVSSARKLAPPPEPAVAHETHAFEINWFDFTTNDPPPMIAVIVNFALMLYVVFLILRRPLSTRFSTRRRTLEEALAEAAELKAEAEKALADARERTEQLDAEIERVRAEIVGGGQGEGDRILTEAAARVERMHDDTSALIEQEIARVAEEIRAEAVEQVSKAAERAVRAQTSPRDHERLKDEYLVALGDRSSSSGATRQENDR